MSILLWEPNSSVSKDEFYAVRYWLITDVLLAVFVLAILKGWVRL